MSATQQPAKPTSTRISPDVIAVAALVIIWGVFFWRILTPNVADQASFRDGDFGRQFYAFSAYQFERFSDGEAPLWNPYNNGGLPFIADVQAAVFYPPRLLNIALTNAFNADWTYNNLQLEAAFHVLLYTLLMYALVRRLTLAQRGTVFASLIAAISIGYGGWLTSYPPLQLAILEAATWLPLALIGVVEATRHEKISWHWLALSGLALGLTWMAGHSQSAWFATYLIVAFIAYRAWAKSYAARHIIAAIAIVGVVTLGVAAVQLLPGFEYLSRTMRVGLGFDEKSNGFVFNDLSTLLYPGSTWSPLYLGVVTLGLAAVGIISQSRDRVFWTLAAGVALLMSFGGNTALYHAMYNVLPGLSFFRGQERAVMIFANGAAILAAYGVIALYAVPDDAFKSRTLRGWMAYALFAFAACVAVYLLWFGNPDTYGAVRDQAFLTAIVVAAAWWIITKLVQSPTGALGAALVGLIAFELLTVNIDREFNYQTIPAAEQTLMRVPPLVEQVQADDDPASRVEGGIIAGQIGMPPGGNTGSLYGVRDIRGISPLFLDGPHAIIQRESPAPVAWEVFSVKYVFSEADALPVTSQVVGEDRFLDTPVYLHELTNPRPFAQLMTDFEVAPGDAFARQLLATPEFDARSTLILAEAPPLDITPGERLADDAVTITHYEPERIEIAVNAPTNALLSVAHVDYPGWHVRVDGERVKPIRAYGSVIAIPIPAGEHIITLTYDPLSYRAGALLSLVTWAGLGILGGVIVFRGRGTG